MRGEAGRPPGRLFIQEGGSKGGREVDKFARYSGEALTEFTDGLAVGEEKESKIMARVLALKTGWGLVVPLIELKGPEESGMPCSCQQHVTHEIP